MKTACNLCRYRRRFGMVLVDHIPDFESTCLHPDVCDFVFDPITGADKAVRVGVCSVLNTGNCKYFEKKLSIFERFWERVGA